MDGQKRFLSVSLVEESCPGTGLGLVHYLLVIKLRNNADRITAMFETVRKQAGIYFFLTQNKSKSSKNFKKAVKSAGNRVVN